MILAPTTLTLSRLITHTPVEGEAGSSCLPRRFDSSGDDRSDLTKTNTRTTLFPCHSHESMSRALTRERPSHDLNSCHCNENKPDTHPHRHSCEGTSPRTPIRGGNPSPAVAVRQVRTGATTAIFISLYGLHKAIVIRSGARNPISSFHRSRSLRNAPYFLSTTSGYVRICQAIAYPHYPRRHSLSEPSAVSHRLHPQCRYALNSQCNKMQQNATKCAKYSLPSPSLKERRG